jgi:hypothetical protein
MWQKGRQAIEGSDVVRRRGPTKNVLKIGDDVRSGGVAVTTSQGFSIKEETTEETKGAHLR